MLRREPKPRPQAKKTKLIGQVALKFVQAVWDY
jgi:hypothetical protein